MIRINNIIKQIIKNSLFQYTVFSFLIIMFISLGLEKKITNITQEHSVKMHASYYLKFTKTFSENHPQVFEFLLGACQKGSIEEEFTHFLEDLSYSPSLLNIRFISIENVVIWTYNETPFLSDKNLLNNLNNVKKSKFIYTLKNNEKLYLLLPVKKEGDIIGFFEIIDSDNDFITTAKENRKTIIKSLIIVGIIFYLLLISLFVKINHKQKNIIERTKEIQSLTIHSMSLLAELRDNDTGAHIIRTKKYCYLLAKELQKSKVYRKYIGNDYLVDLEKAAPLHDIGKVGIPDNILLKPGKLTDKEFLIIKTHPILGANVLQKAIGETKYKTYFDIAIHLIKHHHENWDGTGYPDGLSGEDIPLSARIMTIADVYDALVSERVYKKAIMHEDALKMIINESGKKFDPALIEVFKNVSKDFESISKRLR